MNQICLHCNAWMLEFQKIFYKCIGCGFYKMKDELVSLEQWTMGRDKTYSQEWTKEIETNAKELLVNVNAFLNELEIKNVSVSSGWRPEAINKAAGGAKKSQHTIGKAVDLKDPDGKLKDKCEENDTLLKKYGLWMEHRDSTPTWLHLDNKDRGKRDKNIFKP